MALPECDNMNCGKINTATGNYEYCPVCEEMNKVLWEQLQAELAAVKVGLADYKEYRKRAYEKYAVDAAQIKTLLAENERLEKELTESKRECKEGWRRWKCLLATK